jgi:hypothetical protein
MGQNARWVATLFVSVFASACANGAGEDPTVGSTSDAITSSGPALPAEVTRCLSNPHGLTPEQLDRLYTVEHNVPVGPGRRVHVTEKFTLRSWLRWPHRAMLMLPGTISKGSFFNPDVDGYRFQDEVARRGFFAFTVDYEGSGTSTYPANGLDVTHSYLVNSMRPVLAYTRLIRLVPRVDVLGESNGGAIAAELCDDATRVRSCTMSSMIYKEGTPFFNAVFQNPGFIGFLQSQPNGYLDVDASYYFNITLTSPPAVSAWVLANQPGRYAVAPLTVAATLPWFDPSRARVPGLIIQGTLDDIGTQNDSDLLAADYGSAPGAGGHATIARIAGASHIPRVDPAPLNTQWNSTVLSFVDP